MQEKIGSPTRISAEENSANELLESMGYKPELQRDRSTLQVAFMAFVLASVPYGLATGLNWPVVGGGPVNIIWGWVAVSLVVMCVAASLGEITSIYPTAGGIFYFLICCVPYHLSSQYPSPILFSLQCSLN